VRGDRWTSYLHGNSWSTLYHELVHLALGGRGLPRWVEEGLAEVVAARLCRDRSRPSPALPLDRLAQLVSGMRYNDWLPLPDLLSAKRREFVGDRAERYYALAAVLVAYLAQRSEAAKRRPSDELRLLAAPRGLQRLDVSAFRRFIDGRFASRPRRLDLLQGEPCSWQNTILGGWHFLRGQLVGRDASAIERPLLPRRRFELSLEGALGVGHLIVRLGSVYDRDPPALWLLRVDPKRVAIARGDVKPLVWRGVERSDATRFDLRLIFDERRVRLWIGGRTRIEFPRRHNFVSSIRLENRGLVTLRRLRLAER
ncbi:MAG: hypothetical protein KC609_03790, partial [Myxococcales bacterium]|nr:hypothetical protein [Myxococcales bacterium]